MKKLLALMFCVMLGGAALLTGCGAPKQSSESASPQMDQSAPMTNDGGAGMMEEATPATNGEGAAATEEATPGADGSQMNDEGTEAQ